MNLDATHTENLEREPVAAQDPLLAAAEIAQGYVDEMNATLRQCDEAIYVATFPRRRAAMLGRMARQGIRPIMDYQ